MVVIRAMGAPLLEVQGLRTSIYLDEGVVAR
jgi:hypothetical protein